MNPLISIIIPVYKVEKYLVKCVESVQSQKYTHLEIILINDGSPDNCGAICDSFAEKDNRIKVIHKQNGGLSDARNCGLSQISGDFVTFVDSDDYVDEDYVSNLVNLVQKYQTKIAVTFFRHVCEGRNIDSRQELKEDSLNRFEALQTMFYQEKFDTNSTAKLFHQSLFDEVRFPIGLLYEDLLTTYKLILLADEGIAVSDLQTYNYLLRDDSIEGAPFSEKKMQSLLFIINDLEEAKKEMHGLENSINCRILSLLLHLLFETKKNSTNEKDIFRIVRKYRKGVLLDGNARRKARIAAVISYLGLPSLRFFYKFGKSRN